MKYERIKIVSHFDIFIDGRRIGLGSVSYHYGPNRSYDDSYLSGELFLDQEIKHIKQIKLAEDMFNLQLYAEKHLNTLKNLTEQAKDCINYLIQITIINRKNYNIEINLRRETHRILIDRDGVNHRLVITHDTTLNYKDVYIGASGGAHAKYSALDDDEMIIRSFLN